MNVGVFYMQLKRSLFGGYKKRMTDEFIKNLTENEENAQARIALIESELRLLKDSSQRNLESVQAELLMKHKSIADLSKIIEEKSSQLLLIQQEIEDTKLEAEEKIKENIAIIEENHKLKSDNENEQLQEKISFLETQYSQMADKVRANDEQTRKIGQIYIDAYNYTEKMKKKTRDLLNDEIDRIFADLYSVQDQFEAFSGQINLKKRTLKQLSREMSEVLQTLIVKVDSLDQEQINPQSPLVSIKAASDRIYIKISKIFESEDFEDQQVNEQPKTANTQKDIEQPKIPNDPQINILPETEPANEEEFLTDYETQINDLRKLVIKQQELLEIHSNKAIEKGESLIKSISPEMSDLNENEQAPIPAIESKNDVEEISENDVASNFDVTDLEENSPKDQNVMKFSYNELNAESDDSILGISDADSTSNLTPKDENENSEGIVNRFEREKKERDNYSRYFEEIGKKYSKDISDSYPAYIKETDKPSIMMSKENETTEELSANEELSGNAKEESEVLPSKRPSIKDILNKYANMK